LHWSIPDDGSILATMKVTEKYAIDKAHECATVFKTTDLEHPGVKMVMEQGEINLAGPIKVLSLGGFPETYGELLMSPKETRALFESYGWSKVAAFQTRNPMHRSHEYLAKVAIETCDGVLVHSLLGNLKPGDIPADVRSEAIGTLIDNYFVKKTVIQAGYPLDMRYAGPREALLHALFRQNYGCSHLIVGRDHAGVGSYYGPFDAHHIFDECPRARWRPRRSRSTGPSGATSAAAWLRRVPARTARRSPAAVRHQAAQDAFRRRRGSRRVFASRSAGSPAQVLRQPRSEEKVEVKLSGHSAR
jgi:sulfate adenylyltransferase